MSTKATTLTSQIRIGRCSSCGEILQELNPNAVGYISHARRVKHLDNGLCDRCYSLRHSENSRAPEFGEDYIKILEKIKESGALAVFVCSIPDLDSSCIQNIGEYLPSNLIVVLNKKDVVGMELDDKQIASSALKRLKAEKIFPSKAIVTSPMKDYHIRELLDLINSMRQGKDVYVLGAYSVGKSSLINAILRKYVNNTSRVISTSQVEGTSLQVMEIPLDDESLSCRLIGTTTWRDVLMDTTDFSYQFNGISYQIVILDAQLDIFSNLFLSFSNGERKTSLMVKSILGLDEIPKPDDAADALAVAVTCSSSLAYLRLMNEM